MKPIWGHIWLICLLLLPACPANAQRTAFADFPDIDVKSPGGKAMVSVRSQAPHILTVKGKTYRLAQLNRYAAPPSLVDVRWSPDSQLFIANVSDGGWVGTWHPVAYRLTASGTPHFVDIEHILLPKLQNYTHCISSEAPNLQAVEWSRDGRRIAILASVPNHSSCRNMGDYKGFVLDTRTWRVLRTVPRGRVPSRWIDKTTGGV